jgi:hypothetical protein
MSAMARLFYREERDEDFLNACEQVRQKEPFLPARLIAAKAAYRKAGSFYLHHREYAKIVYSGGSRLPKSPLKKEMHTEICKCIETLVSENPGMTVHEASGILSGQEAPRFYISKRRSEDLYYSLLRRKNKHP